MLANMYITAEATFSKRRRYLTYTLFTKPTTPAACSQGSLLPASHSHFLRRWTLMGERLCQNLPNGLKNCDITMYYIV